MNAPTIDEIKTTASAIRENVGKVVVGKGDVVDLALVALLCEGHILFEDIPGIGKTTMAKALARSLRVPPHPIHTRPAAQRCDRAFGLQPKDAGI
jgi:MoxR-like ATPase